MRVSAWALADKHGHFMHRFVGAAFDGFTFATFRTRKAANEFLDSQGYFVDRGYKPVKVSITINEVGV